MRLWVSIGLAVVACLTSSYAQLFYGTPSYQIGSADGGQITLTNADTNIWYLTSVGGTSSNNAPMAGSFSVWHIRSNYSNKLFTFSFTDVTNFVWEPDNKVRIGRNDRLGFKYTATNTLFLLLGQDR